MQSLFSTVSTWLMLLIACVVPATLHAQPAPWSPLLDVNTLAGMLALPAEQAADSPVSDRTVSDIPEDVAGARSVDADAVAVLRIVQITGDPGDGLIPGAVYVPYAEFRGPATNAGQLPSAEKLQSLVQRLGIRADTPVVIVHQGSSASDFGAAARVYWMLKSLGVRQPAVLNGGYQQWLAAGFPVSQQPAEVPASDFRPVWNDSWYMSTQNVQASLGNDRVRLLDSRPLAFYLGQQAVASRPGTIQGAGHLSYETWFDGALIKPVDQLQPLLTQTGLPASQPFTTVAFCNTGHWAAINWFVLSELLHVPDTRLYAESTVEWAQQALPMQNQPSRLRWYLKMTRDWLSQVLN